MGQWWDWGAMPSAELRGASAELPQISRNKTVLKPQTTSGASESFSPKQ